MIAYTLVPNWWPLWLVRSACHCNTLRPRQNGRHFTDDIFKCIFLNENVSISIEISPKIVPKYPINNIPSLVQIMAWCRPGDKPLSEPMMVSLLAHICVTRPQWVKDQRWITLHFAHIVQFSLSENIFSLSSNDILTVAIEIYHHLIISGFFSSLK